MTGWKCNKIEVLEVQENIKTSLWEKTSVESLYK